MKLAFLGLGQMGAGMAARLLSTEHDLTVWNRSRPATGPLAKQGARVAETAAEAVAGADVVFTMLTGDEATRAVVFGDGAAPGFLESMKPGAAHVTLSTIGVDLARRITQAHHGKGQEHLGSPVFGRPHVAADGKLWLAVAGKPEVAETLKPVLERFSRGSSHVGAEPWQAHATKLGGNFLITASIQMLSEAFLYAEAQGIDPAAFLETVNAALFQSAFIGNYGRTILDPPEKPGATVSLGSKDTRLFREAAREAGIASPLADYLADRLREAEAEGWQNEDWAVGQYNVARKMARRR